MFGFLRNACKSNGNNKNNLHASDGFYVIKGQNKKPIATEQIIDFFKQKTDMSEGFLYIGYPLLANYDGSYALDILLISKKHGILIFDVVESSELGNYKERQDDIFNKIQAYLLQYTELTEKRHLVVEPKIVTYAPRCSSLMKRDPDYPIISKAENLENILSNITWENSKYYNQLHSVIQNITSIRSSRYKRNVNQQNSRGAILKRLEDSIANLDHSQAEAVIKTFDGVQRIRGLAGSGKTIVLALKVAYLHSVNPDWNIAVTFTTRSLKKQFETLINRFVWERKKEEPDWNKISIIHAWGSSGERQNQGIYYNLCVSSGNEYLNFKEACSKFGYDYAFQGCCQSLLSKISGKIQPKYDAILIDEAQDFPMEFMKICYELLKEPKRLIYAYDELQNLSGYSVKSPEELFGSDSNGTPKVSQGKYDDIILYKCYRNSRPVLATAHALGFGIYRDGGLIQMFDNQKLWNDIGYKAVKGHIQSGTEVSLARNNDTSPEFLEDLAPKNDLIIFKSFSSKEEQTEYLVNDIVNNIEKEELLHSDIIIINSNPMTTQKEVSDARAKLYEKGINTNIAGISTSPDVFQEQDAITFTGIYRAKGNEAGLVYIINADECFDGAALAKKRNILFTAITRSKAWVRVLGCGDKMNKLIEEYNKVKEHNYELNFIYPTPDEMKKMNILNRDLDSQTKQNIQNINVGLESFLKSIDNGDVLIEDLNPEIRERLKSLL